MEIIVGLLAAAAVVLVFVYKKRRGPRSGDGSDNSGGPYF